MVKTITIQKKDEPRGEASRSEVPRFLPRTDILEGEREWLLQLEVPGAGENDVDVRVERGLLSVHARVTPFDSGGREEVLREVEEGDFARTFRLSDSLDTERIEARLAAGVLEIRLPKREAAQPKKIAIKRG